MVFDFVFQEEKVLKGNFVDWFVQKVTQAGWVHVNPNKPVDNYLFRSTGVSGQESLRFQMKDYYRTATASRFQTSTTGIMGFRVFSSYAPNPSPNSAGQVYPNTTWQEARICTDMGPDNYLTVNYFINADKVIMVIESGPITDSFSGFVSLGKTHHFHDTTNVPDSEMAIMVSHSVADADLACRSYIKGFGVTQTVHTSSWITFPTLNPINSQIAMSEMVASHPIAGMSFQVENIFHARYFNKKPKQYLSGTTLEDTEGRIFKLIANEATYAGTAMFDFYAIRVG